MAIYYRYTSSTIMVLGNTYHHKEAIKALGGRFVGDRKIWQLPNSAATLDEIAKLCQLSGGGPLDQPAEATAPEAQLNPSLMNRPFASPQQTAPTRPVTLPSHSEPSLWTLPQADEAATAKTMPGVGNDAASDGLSLSQLLERAQMAITGAFPGALWVLGEIQNCQNRGRGVYLSLAEEDRGGRGQGTITIQAVIWEQALRNMAQRHGRDKINEVLQDGLQVRCLCQVTLYKGRGNLSLTITDIDVSYTQGALALAREKLLRELRAKGLDSANKLRYLPALPFRVGLLTADGSRAHSDFLHQLEEGGFPGEVVFVSVAVQGDKVPREVPRGLAQLAAQGCDVIVLTRGGGSAADLRWFDMPEVAYAVAHCPVPVIAAIGHHDDFCVAEEICYHRRKTPTAAADFILGCFHEVHERLEKAAKLLQHHLTVSARFFSEKQAQLCERLTRSSSEALRRRYDILLQQDHKLERAAREQLHQGERVLQRLALALPQAAGAHLQACDTHLHRTLLRRLQEATHKQFEQHAMRLVDLDRQLVRQDPSPWLAQGWTCLYNRQGKVSSLADLAVGDELKARLSDGLVQLKVTAKEAHVSAQFPSIEEERPDHA